MLSKITNLGEPHRAVRPHLNAILNNTPPEVIKKHSDKLAKSERCYDQHEASNPKRRKSHQKCQQARNQHCQPNCRQYCPSEDHGENGSSIGPNGKKPCLSQRQLPSQQKNVRGQPEQGVDANGIDQIKKIIHLNRLSCIRTLHLIPRDCFSEQTIRTKNQENKQ